MALTLDDLFASPDHYLHSFEGSSAIFVPMDRAAYHRSIFLDDRISPAADGAMHVPLDLLANVARPDPAAATGWIFHVAHCGSTLLARALDDPARNLVLREPLALRQLALAPDAGRLALVAAMLSKRYAADAPTVVKANVPVNFLLGELAARDPSARAIFLHLSLRDYLLAILRNDNHRAWLRRITVQVGASLGAGALDDRPDAERAAILWLAQIEAFATAAQRLPHARSLDAEAFFNAPRDLLAAAATQVQVALPVAALDAVVAGPLFATYSKNPALPFGNAARIARARAAEQALTQSGELDVAERWLDRHAARANAALAMLRAVALDA